MANPYLVNKLWKTVISVSVTAGRMENYIMKQYSQTIIETEDSIYEYDEECMKCINSNTNSTKHFIENPAKDFVPQTGNFSEVHFHADNDDNLFTLLVCFKFAESYLSSVMHIL